VRTSYIVLLFWFNYHMELTDVQRAELAALVKDRYVYPEVARRAQMILWESVPRQARRRNGIPASLGPRQSTPAHSYLCVPVDLP
jgi:hypothetical protein